MFDLKKVEKCGDFLLRVVTGLIFVMAGYGKLFAQPGIAGFTGMLTGLGIPLPNVFAVLVGIVELAGGILLILGLWSQIASAFLAFIILVAIFTVHIPNGWGDYRYPLLLFAVLVRYVGAKSQCDLPELIKKIKQ